jgi:arylsulfatase A-like enzyme
VTSLTGHGYHVFDDFVRVPLVLAGPGVPNLGHVFSEQVGQIDIFPTILELAELADKTPPALDGRSLVPLIRGERLEPVPAFIESWISDAEPAPYHGVRTATWKYVYSPSNPDCDSALYDLQTDAEEKVNVAADHPDILAKMQYLARTHFQASQPAREAGAHLTEQEQADLAEHLRGLGYIE